MATRTGFKKGFKQGLYEPKYPDKWVITEAFDMKERGIKYRSSWELKFCRFADFNPDIIKVNSEGVVIPYMNPVRGKVSKYYMDFVIQTKSTVFLVEVKPLKDVNPPKPPKAKTEKGMQNYAKAIETFAVNQAKWEAAEKFAAQKGWKFKIITERELGL